MSEILGLSLLAAFFELDVTAFGQIMISRPMIVGPVFGLLLGDVVSGFWIGIIVELIWIDSIPMGTSVPLDVTVISVLTAVWGISYLGGGKAAIIAALAVAVPLGYLFRYFDIRLRYFNSGIARWIERGIRQGKEARITSGIYLGVFLFFIKAFFFYVIFMALGKILMRMMFAAVPLGVRSGLEISWYVLPVIGFGIVLVNAFYGKLSCRK